MSKGTGDKFHGPGQSNGPEASTEQKWVEVALVGARARARVRVGVRVRVRVRLGP